MNRILALAICLLTACVTTLAQQNSTDSTATKEDVQRYLLVAHSKEMAQKTMAAMTKPMHQMAHETCSKDGMPADCEARLNKVQDEMMANMPWDEMLDAMVPIYQKHFTKNDMDNLVAFYSSPTGQKLLNEMPSIMAELMQDMMPILRKRADAMTQRMQDEIAAITREANGQKSKTTPQTNN